MQTPPSNPSTPPFSSEAGAIDLQTELLRDILEELKALRQDQHQANAQLATAAEYASRLLARWDSDVLPGTTAA